MYKRTLLNLEVYLMYVCKNKSTNYIDVLSLVSQIAMNLGEHFTSIYKVKVIYMNGISIFMLRRDTS